MFRRQLPAYSPLTLRGLVAGMRGVGSQPLERLEALLAERYQADRVVLTGSGTEALTLALRHSVPEGDTPVVALPAYACFDLVSAAVGADARIVFYDVDPPTLGPDFESLTEACTKKPDAVVVAPLYGIPVDWDLVRAAVEPCGALLVEDAAQGLGATWHGQPLGSLGDMSVLSFGRGKGWTGGMGGALLERAARRPASLPLVETVGDPAVAIRAAAQWMLGRPSLYWLPTSLPWLALGETEYHLPKEPEAMPRVAASLVLAHEPDALRESETRKRNAAELLRRLSIPLATGVSLIRVPAGAEAGYLRLPLLAAHGGPALGDATTARRLGIMPGYPLSLPELRAVRERRLAGPPTPGAHRCVSEVFTLPTHGRLSIDDRERSLALIEANLVAAVRDRGRVSRRDAGVQRPVDDT